MPQKNRADSSDKISDDTPTVEPTGAPELDPKVLDVNRQAEIEAAFNVENDADVVAELPDESAQSQAEPSDAASEPTPAVDEPASDSRWKRFWRGYWQRKLWTLPLTILVLVGIIMAVPASRYVLLGTFVKNEVTLLILDQTTHRPVISAVIQSGGVSAMTDTEGRATMRLPVGERDFAISKRYYRSSNFRMLVPAFKKDVNEDVKIQATGRQVPLAVVNKLSGKPVADVILKAAGSEIKTDKDGKATIVLPADAPQQAVELSADKFNGLKGTLVVTEAVDPKNTFQLTPAGKVYFLSKQSGRIDVVKTDLDGSNRQTIVAGTGREEDRNTILLASRDWKHLALLSRRDSEKPKLYHITTGNDKMTVMDEGEANFQLVGWSDDTFVYSVDRIKLAEWQPGKTVLKSYDASSAKLATLDQNQAEGNANDYKIQQVQNFYIVDKKVVYATRWYTNNYQSSDSFNSKTATIRSVAVNGQAKKDVFSMPAGGVGGISGQLYAPGEVYFSMYVSRPQTGTSGQEFYEYEDGAVKKVELDQEEFYNKSYPTYLASPDDNKVFWSEQRDGKEVFFTGNATAEDPKQVAVLPEHAVYGWYTNDYVLVSKKGSELYVLPTNGSKVTKVTDYHRPNASFPGYGGGYGGL